VNNSTNESPGMESVQNSSEVASTLGKGDNLFRKTKVRWLVIFLIGSLNVGYMFSSDYASILSNYFLDSGFEKTQLSLFQIVYSFPNLILPLIAGLVIDKIGSR
jgi:MFS family permease